jgi:hypothetical protein
VSGLTPDQKRALVASRADWFHAIDVGDGIITPGTTPPPYLEMMWKVMHVPEDTLRDLDPRLVDTPIYRFHRLNELGGDYSNWFGGNIAAVSESLASAGFTPELLGTWDDRAMFKAVKNPLTPREWEMGSYEGTRFTFNADGTWASHWIDPRKEGLPDRWSRK